MTGISILIFAVLIAVCLGQTTRGNYNRIVKLEGKVSALSRLVDQIRGKTTRYLGCYKDDAHRLIKDSWVQSGHMTINWCINHCQEGNHKYAGLEFYDHCFCGNYLNTAKYPRTPESQCNTRCKGNGNQMCGGTWRLSIWKLK